MDFEKRVDLIAVALDGMTRDEWELVQRMVKSELDKQEEEIKKTATLCTDNLKGRINYHATSWG